MWISHGGIFNWPVGEEARLDSGATHKRCWKRNKLGKAEVQIWQVDDFELQLEERERMEDWLNFLLFGK